jgi:citrate synthase
LINIDSTMQSTRLPEGPSLSAAEASQLLGVKPQTLYAYASRGLVRRVGVGKRRRYLLDDLERLKLRQRARSGHGPVAAAALSFGEPVLDTRITEVDEGGPRYRGVPALTLAKQGHAFEAVAELLWSEELPERAPPWRALPGAALRRAPCASLEQLLVTLAALSLGEPLRHQRDPEAERELGRRLLRSMGLLLVGGGPLRPTRSLAQLLGARTAVPTETATRALNVALVLLADHELNASAFAARVAASTDASLPCCLLAALATLSGPRHGGACDRVEALLAEAKTLSRPSDVVERRARRGEAMPGFGHPLYPHGDPRARPLLEATTELCRLPGVEARVGGGLGIARVMERQGLPATVDFGLALLGRALGLAAGQAALLFALGRAAGWVAHALEQRASSTVLRPRARYVGARNGEALLPAEAL